jgi:hypothetical protein
MGWTSHVGLHSKRFSVPTLITVIYALGAAILLAFTWYNTKPQYHGFDWIPVSLLTYPGLAVLLLYFHGENLSNPVVVLIGLCLTAIALYLLTSLICYAVQKWRD